MAAGLVSECVHAATAAAAAAAAADQIGARHHPLASAGGWTIILTTEPIAPCR